MDSTDYIIYLVREVVFDEETLQKLTTRIHSNKLPSNIFNNDIYIFEFLIINNNENENTYDDSRKLNEEYSEDHTESKENNSSISGKGKEPESELSDSSTKGKKSNVTENNPTINNKDIENTYSTLGKEHEDKYFNDELNKPIDDLVIVLPSISVSNDDEPNFSMIASLEDEIKFNPPVKRESSTISNPQAKKKINSNNKLINTVPFKHKLIHPKLPDSKKLKPSMNESCKRHGNFFNFLIIVKKKKYKISLDNVEPFKGSLTETPLTYRQAISQSDKDQWIDVMNSEL